MKVKSLSRARLLVTPGTGAYQAPPSMGFSRQEYYLGSINLLERLTELRNPVYSLGCLFIIKDIKGYESIAR